MLMSVHWPIMVSVSILVITQLDHITALVMMVTFCWRMIEDVQVFLHFDNIHIHLVKYYFASWFNQNAMVKHIIAIIVHSKVMMMMWKCSDVTLMCELLLDIVQFL